MTAPLDGQLVTVLAPSAIQNRRMTFCVTRHWISDHPSGPCTPRRNLWYEWKLFIVACRHANMIVFGWEVESFGEKLVLSGECYWCCNSMEGFLLDYRIYYESEIWAGVWGNKRDLVHLLLGRNKRYPEMTTRERVNGWAFPVTGGHWFCSLK